MAGFVSKLYLGIGALQSGSPWVLAVLAASTLLNAAYFLPLLYRIWFLDPPEVGEAPTDGPPGLVLPAIATAAASLAAGIFAAAPVSPLAWATLIVERNYLP